MMYASACIFSLPIADSKRAVVSCWRKVVHEVCLEGLSLPGKSVVRLTDRPDITIDVYLGCQTTTQNQQQSACIRIQKQLMNSYQLPTLH